MPKKVFTIENTGQLVVIERNWIWRNIVVKLGDSEIGRFETLAPLKQGQLFKTKIGDIHIQYKQALLSGSGFEVWYANNLLSGSINDPVQHWRTGFKTAIFLGLLNITVGMLLAITSTTLFGIVVFILGMMSWWRYSAAELAISAFMFALDAMFTILGILALNSARQLTNIDAVIFFMIFRVMFVVLMARGAFGARKINQPYEKAKNSY